MRAALTSTEPSADGHVEGAGESREPAAHVAGLSVRRGGTVALRGVSLEVRPGEVVAVMGRNGAGKSTLLASLVGQVRATAGSVSLAGLDPPGQHPPRSCAGRGWCRRTRR